MLWVEIVIFLLVAGGVMTLLRVDFKDFFQLAARGKPSTLKDDPSSPTAVIMDAIIPESGI